MRNPTLPLPVTLPIFLAFLVLSPPSCAHIPPTPTFETCAKPEVATIAKTLTPTVAECLGLENYAMCLGAIADVYGWEAVGCAVQEVVAAQALSPRLHPRTLEKHKLEQGSSTSHN